MTAFPDLCVVMDDLILQGDQPEYYWILTGTHTGPGGTGHRVRLSGLERWRLGANGSIAPHRATLMRPSIAVNWNKESNQKE
jgi:hypothetical protein